MAQSAKQLSQDLAGARDKLRGIGHGLEIDGLSGEELARVKRSLNGSANFLHSAITLLEAREHAPAQPKKERDKLPARTVPKGDTAPASAGAAQNPNPNVHVH